MDTQLPFASATTLLELIATKQISPVELTKIYFERIHRIDSQLNAFLLLTYDEAMRSAVSAEKAVLQGDKLGALHGLPIAIKDTQMTKGIRTTNGSVIYEDRVPEKDAAIVERVLGAGAVLLGKTNVPEFGMVGTCENSLGRLGRNPWNTNCTPGGSSGGAAAALAARLCPLATGSDGGGSLRIPAHFCGIYTIKPTQGRVSAYTGLRGDPMPNIFSQNGPMSRTVHDAAILLQVMAGYDNRDPISLRQTPPDFVAALDKPIADLRIAWSSDLGFARVDREVVDVTLKAALAFEQLNCHVEECDVFIPPPYDTFGPLQAADAYANLGQYLPIYGDQMTEFAHFFLEQGAKVTTKDYAKALGYVDLLKAQMNILFEEYHLLLTPTACFPAFPNEKFPGSIRHDSLFPEQYWNGAFTLPINTIGHPAASIPAGFSADGLPIGLHIVGRKGDEETVLAASAGFERARPWIQNQPSVC